MMAVADKYYYTIRSSDGHTVKVLRGDGVPKATDGMGGWTIVSRPRRTALTQWDGRNPYSMDLPVLFDGLGDNISVENDIARLFQMSVGSDFTPPPTVTVDGGVPVKGATWVINGIDWGDDVIYDQASKGNAYRLRQDAVVHLVQYRPEQRVKILTTKVVPNIYVVHRSGETMRTIAKAMYGDARKWTAIKKANPKVRDPNHLKVNTKLRIP
jgi:hypothetical protein